MDALRGTNDLLLREQHRYFRLRHLPGSARQREHNRSIRTLSSLFALMCAPLKLFVSRCASIPSLCKNTAAPVLKHRRKFARLLAVLPLCMVGAIVSL